MREIKFRLRVGSKIVGYEKWYLDYGHSCGYWIYSRDNKVCSVKYIHHTHKDQFIDLHDKKGVEIYEGDILKRPLTEKLHSIKEVFWNEEVSGFCTRPEIPYGSCSFEKEKAEWYEVIGNIYENPELLNGGSSE